MTLFGHSPGGRRAWPPGPCPGATAATVEHGVPLMRSKWVHRTWAHQEGTQGQGSRLADGPPICPKAPRRIRHRQPRQETRGPFGAPSTRKQAWRSRGPNARQEARLIPGNQPPARDKDKLASPGWKLLEDLGARKMEAPKGGRGGKAVSLCPPSLEKVGVGMATGLPPLGDCLFSPVPVQAKLFRTHPHSPLRGLFIPVPVTHRV